MKKTRTTAWFVHTCVFILPVLFWITGLLMHRVEDSAKGPSFIFFLMGLYTGGFAALYGCWLGGVWIVSKFKL